MARVRPNYIILDHDVIFFIDFFVAHTDRRINYVYVCIILTHTLYALRMHNNIIYLFIYGSYVTETYSAYNVRIFYTIICVRANFKSYMFVEICTSDLKVYDILYNIHGRRVYVKFC